MESPVILKILHNGKTKEYFVNKQDKLHTDLGILHLEELKTKSYGDKIISHLGHEFTIQKPRAPDFFKYAKRTGAPMMPKDIGVIIANTGLCSTDIVLDAGTGSGILAIYLGSIAKKVVTYEIRDEFMENARQNVELSGLLNIELRKGDIAVEIQGLDERFDVITLDTAAAKEVIRHIPGIIYPGGFAVIYSPFFEHAKEIRCELHKINPGEVITLENIEREISFGERGTRPSTARVGHTGFITIARF
ncbi:MAG: methyltransferase domain-containing protein [Candidatus Methanoperedens sp.]|nr:methyltransferase domain-containing protein [Candidatus Methanoperedens sp.]